MRTIAKFADAKGTIQGKALSVFLSILLTFCFMNAFGWNDFAVADETNGDTNTVVVEGSESGEPELQVQNTSENQNIVVAQSDTTGDIEMTASESTDETTDGSEENTGNENGAGSTEQTPVEPYVFDETTGTLTITGVDTITKSDVAKYKSTTKNLVITEVGFIEKEVFAEFNSMTSLTITNVDHIGYSFRSCTKLETLKIEHVGEIDTFAFYNPAKLKTVYMDDVQKIGENVFNVYGGATALTDVTLKNLSVGSRMFAEHKLLTNLVFENIDTIGFQAFMNCTGIAGDISSVLNGNVKEVGDSAFYGCTGLTSLNLDGVDIKTHPFFGCSGLTEITISNANILGNYAFTGCSGIKSANISNVGTIGDNCFAAYSGTTACIALETVSISNVDSFGKYILKGCAGLKEVEISDCAKLGEYSFGEMPSYGAKTAEDASINVTLRNIDKIEQYAFSSSSGIKSIVLSGIDIVANGAFWCCTGLTTVKGLDSVKASIGGFAFYGCSSLNYEDISVNALTKMGYIGLCDEILARVKAILAGKFGLNSVEIEELMLEGWTAGAVDRSSNWNGYDNGTQLMEQARWSENDGVAEVKVDAYYTGKKQMDYIFVADLSGSMAHLGNASDNNARFYDMQSKLLDMTNKLLNTEGYDCQVAIVGFGGYHAGNATRLNSGFLDSYDKAENFIISDLKPLNENTDYGIGMQEAKALVKSNSGRNTVVVFLSDGAPNVGNSGDQDGTIAASEIKALGVDIYGVLHSPTAAQHDSALAKMQAVCGDNTVYESTDTKTFGEAMNAAFAAAYGKNVVTIPVNSEQFDVANLKATAGDVKYADGIITWVLSGSDDGSELDGGMPFKQHTLTYELSLKDELANRVGTYSYSINNGNATFGENMATVDLDLSLSRTVNPAQSDDDDTTGGTTTEPETPVTPDPATPTPTPATPAATAPAATPAAAPAAPAAAPAAPAAVIPDDANPLAAEPTDEGATIEDEENPLAAFDPDTDLNCWVHWLIIAGMLVTLVYGIAVIRRRNSFTNQITNFEDDLLGNTQDAANQAPAGAYSHAVR